MDNNLKCVYRHRRADNNEVFYVGIGTKKRPYEFWDRSKFWKKIKNKSGGVIVEILAENLSLEDAYDLEKLLISEYGRRDNNTGILVNHTDGGDGSLNVVITLEQRKTLSKRFKGRKFTDQHKQNLSESLKKAVRSEKTLEKLRNGPTVFKKGHKLSEIEIENLKKRFSKKVYCTVNGNIWNSIKECAEENNISPITLGQKLSERRKNNTTFKYLKDAV